MRNRVGLVKITYRPWQELVVHEILEYEPQELFSIIVKQGLATGAVGITPSMNWADGVVFTFAPFPDTEDVIRDKLKGIVHYAVVQFAALPDYRSEVTVNLAGTQHSVRLQKVEVNPIFSEIAKFLKERGYTK